MPETLRKPISKTYCSQRINWFCLCSTIFLESRVKITRALSNKINSCGSIHLLRLCGLRGFCAGVDLAIQIVVLALKNMGEPVYVRHEIVHNRYVVEGLQARGAIFVEALSEIPLRDRGQPVVFFAHGVSKISASGCPIANSILSRRHLSPTESHLWC